MNSNSQCSCYSCHHTCTVQCYSLSRLLQISSFSGKMNALNEVGTCIHVLYVWFNWHAMMCALSFLIFRCKYFLFINCPQINKIVPTVTYDPHFRPQDDDQMHAEKLSVSYKTLHFLFDHLCSQHTLWSSVGVLCVV